MLSPETTTITESPRRNILGTTRSRVIAFRPPGGTSFQISRTFSRTLQVVAQKAGKRERTRKPWDQALHSDYRSDALGTAESRFHNAADQVAHACAQCSECVRRCTSRLVNPKPQRSHASRISLTAQTQQLQLQRGSSVGNALPPAPKRSLVAESRHGGSTAAARRVELPLRVSSAEPRLLMRKMHSAPENPRAGAAYSHGDLTCYSVGRRLVLVPRFCDCFAN